MLSISLAPGEFTLAELPLDDSFKSITINASGKVAIDVQSSRDGATWSNPVAQARLNTEERTLALHLPQQTKKIRVILHNDNSQPAIVHISDPVAPTPEVNATQTSATPQ
jgi:hypothetical protein